MMPDGIWLQTLAANVGRNTRLRNTTLHDGQAIMPEPITLATCG